MATKKKGHVKLDGKEYMLVVDRNGNLQGSSRTSLTDPFAQSVAGGKATAEKIFYFDAGVGAAREDGSHRFMAGWGVDSRSGNLIRGTKAFPTVPVRGYSDVLTESKLDTLSSVIIGDAPGAVGTGLAVSYQPSFSAAYRGLSVLVRRVPEYLTGSIKVRVTFSTPDGTPRLGEVSYPVTGGLWESEEYFWLEYIAAANGTIAASVHYLVFEVTDANTAVEFLVDTDNTRPISTYVPSVWSPPLYDDSPFLRFNDTTEPYMPVVSMVLHSTEIERVLYAASGADVYTWEENIAGIAGHDVPYWKQEYSGTEKIEQLIIYGKRLYIIYAGEADCQTYDVDEGWLDTNGLDADHMIVHDSLLWRSVGSYLEGSVLGLISIPGEDSLTGDGNFGTQAVFDTWAAAGSSGSYWKSTDGDPTSGCAGLAAGGSIKKIFNVYGTGNLSIRFKWRCEHQNSMFQIIVNADTVTVHTETFSANALWTDGAIDINDSKPGSYDIEFIDIANLASRDSFVDTIFITQDIGGNVGRFGTAESYIGNVTDDIQALASIGGSLLVVKGRSVYECIYPQDYPLTEYSVRNLHGFVLLDFHEDEAVRNWAMTWHDGLYFPRSGGVIEYKSGTVRDLWAEKTDVEVTQIAREGEPYEAQGTFSPLAFPGPSRWSAAAPMMRGALFAKTNPSFDPDHVLPNDIEVMQLFYYDGRQWHQFYSGVPNYMEECWCIFTQPKGEGEARVWFGRGMDIYYMDIVNWSDGMQYIPDWQFVDYGKGGYATLPLLDDGQPTLLKDFVSIQVIGKQLSGGVLFRYAIDGHIHDYHEDGVYLGSITSEADTLFFPADTAGKSIHIGLEFAVWEPDKSPVIERVILNYQPLPDTVIQSEVVVRVGDHIQMLDGTYDPRASKEVWANLQALVELAEPFIFEDEYGVNSYCRVMAVRKSDIAFVDTAGDGWSVEGSALLSMLQIPELGNPVSGPIDLIQNGEFTTNADNWDLTGVTWDGSDGSPTPGCINGESGEYIDQDVTSPMADGNRFALSFAVKIDSVLGPFSVWWSISDDEGPIYADQIAISIYETWIGLTAKDILGGAPDNWLHLPKGELTVRINAPTGAGAGEFYLDDVKLVSELPVEV